MVLSVRGIASSCLGVNGDISIRNDVYGYIWGPMARDLRLKRHLELISGQALNLSLILVAHENDFSGEFTRDECRLIQEAVDRMRGLYAQVNLGVRRLYWLRIPVADANGYITVDGSQATDLTNDWSGDNDGIDVFWVSNITDAGGWSNRDGPCDKDEDKERTGVVIQITNSGRLLGHEVGHYLRLSHGSDPDNLMGVDANDNGVAETIGTELTNSQGNTMKRSCFVKFPCA